MVFISYALAGLAIYLRSEFLFDHLRNGNQMAFIRIKLSLCSVMIQKRNLGWSLDPKVILVMAFFDIRANRA